MKTLSFNSPVHDCGKSTDGESELGFRFRDRKGFGLSASVEFPPIPASSPQSLTALRVLFLLHGPLMYSLGQRNKIKAVDIACEYTLGECQWQRTDRDSEIVRPGCSPVCTSSFGNGERGVGGCEVPLPLVLVL
jgi:hypothetical protein